MSAFERDLFRMFGAVIAELRYGRGLTILQLSRRSGLDKSALVRLETGYTWPRQKNLQKIIKALGVTHRTFAQEMIRYMEYHLDIESNASDEIQGENGGVMTPP